MQSQSAGEQTVAEADLDDIVGGHAARASNTRDTVRPDVKVFLGVYAGGGLSGGAGGRVDTHDVLHVSRDQSERIVIAEVILGGEGDVLDIGQLLDLAAVQNAAVGQTLMIQRYVVIAVLDDPFQPFELKRLDLFSR